MKVRLAPIIVILAISSCAPIGPSPDPAEGWFPPANEAGDPVVAVYEGRVPCSEVDPPNCDKIKLALVLYRNPASGALTSYELARVYVADTPEGRQERSKGVISVTRGTALDPAATVYELDSATPPDFQFYWVIGDDILFVLDAQRTPKVGTASWSYVLNRTK